MPTRRLTQRGDATTFHIGSQQGVINNVQGDQTIYGGQTVAIASPAEALTVVAHIRREVDGTPLPSRTSAAAKRELADIEQELRQREPDKKTIGERLTRLTKVLISAGALVTGGTTLLTALTGLATWLGAFGAGALGLLRGQS